MVQARIFVHMKLDAVNRRLRLLPLGRKLQERRLEPFVQEAYREIESYQIVEGPLENLIQNPHIFVVAITTHHEREIIG